MKSLADLFLTHAIPGIRDAHIRHIVAEKVTALINIPIQPKQVNLKEGILQLSVPPVVKSALLLKADELKKLLLEEKIAFTAIR